MQINVLMSKSFEQKNRKIN